MNTLLVKKVMPFTRFISIGLMWFLEESFVQILEKQLISSSLNIAHIFTLFFSIPGRYLEINLQTLDVHSVTNLQVHCCNCWSLGAIYVDPHSGIREQTIDLLVFVLKLCFGMSYVSLTNY